MDLNSARSSAYRDNMDKYGCKGALDWEIEVLSPSTQRHDQFMKLILYHKAGAGVLGR